jgi:hypothetical protein
MQLANLFQLNAEPVTERAFRPEFIEQGFCPFEGVGRNVFALKEISETTLNFRFGKQGELLGAAKKNRRGGSIFDHEPQSHSIAILRPCKSDCQARPRASISGGNFS